MTPILAPALLLRSETAGSLRPDAFGLGAPSVAERITLEAPLPRGWVLAGDGGVRQAPLDRTPRADLWQLQLTWESTARGVTVGRQHLLGPRGFLQVDGVAARVDDGGAWGATAWAGRLWDAEEWDIADVYVGGAQVTRRPSRGTRLDLGAELRAVDAVPQPRVFAAAAADTVRGDRVQGVVETSDEAFDASVDGVLVATKRVDLGAAVRWQGLDPARGPRTPWELLAPDGYGIGEARAAWHRGVWSLRGAAGPTWVHDDVGAAGQLSAGAASPSGASVAVFGRLAGIGGSGLAGGGVEVRPVPEWVVDAALYGLQPLDGDAGTVWEVRARGTSPRPGWGASVDTALFSDATLRLGFRAGLALRLGSPPVPGTGGRP